MSKLEVERLKPFTREIVAMAQQANGPYRWESFEIEVRDILTRVLTEQRDELLNGGVSVMSLLLVWQNDALLGIYADTPLGRRKANECMAKVRRLDTSAEWERLPSGRWYQKGGSVARLSVERSEVIK